MPYTLVNKLTPVNTTLSFENAEQWKSAMNFDTDHFVNSVPGLTEVSVVLNDDMKSATVTKVYENLDARLNHVSRSDEDALPIFRNDMIYSNEFISESEPTANYYLMYS